MTFTQAEFDIRCEWGEEGVRRLAPLSDVIIVVDVLSFSTSVEIAVSRGATIFPYRGPAERLADFAASVDARWVAPGREKGGLSLSPEAMMQIAAGTRLVLPSPNGSTLSLAAGTTPVLAGCLRNARAVAKAALRLGPSVSVIPAGERWRPGGGLRPAFEDWLGAGAIINYLEGHLSPEARSALAAFTQEAAVETSLMQCGSGKELIARGFTEDVRLAAQLNAGARAPLLQDGAYR